MTIITQLKCANFSNTLSPIDRSVKLKLNKEMMQWNDVISQTDLTYIHRIFHKTPKNMCSSQRPMGFLQIDHILGHKAHCLSFEHQRLKLDINNRESKKYTNSWKLNKSLLNQNLSWLKLKRKLTFSFYKWLKRKM